LPRFGHIPSDLRTASAQGRHQHFQLASDIPVRRSGSRIGLRRAEGLEQQSELLIVGAAQAHSEVRALRGGQQPDAAPPLSRRV